MDASWKKVLGTAVTYKVLSTLLVLLFFGLRTSENNLWNRWYTGDELDAVYIPFSNWDAQHYLFLADVGYARAEEHSLAFYPLLPLSIAAVRVVARDLYLAALITVTLFVALFVVFFYRYAREELGPDRAFLALTLALAFPTAFYTSVFYTEGLFLALLFGFLLFHRKEHPAAVAYAALLPLARGQGFFVAAGYLVYLAWCAVRRKPGKLGYRIANLGGFASGIAGYFAFFQLTRGDMGAGLRSQGTFVFSNSIANIFNPVRFVEFLASQSDGFFAYNNALVDKIFIVLMFLFFFWVVKSRSALHIVLFLVLVYCPAAMGQGGAFTRYALLGFPLVAISLTRTGLDSRPGRVFIAVILVVFVLLQVAFIYRFATNLWVA